VGKKKKKGKTTVLNDFAVDRKPLCPRLGIHTPTQKKKTNYKT